MPNTPALISGPQIDLEEHKALMQSIKQRKFPIFLFNEMVAFHGRCFQYHSGCCPRNISEMRAFPYTRNKSTRFLSMAFIYPMCIIDISSYCQRQSTHVKLKDKTVAPLIELTEDGIVKSINVPLSPKKSAPMQPATTQKKKINPRDFLTEEILMAGSTAKMAELVAKEIYNIRESKNALVRGQADNMPKDGEQLKIMLANLEEQEAAMTEMFSGTLNKDEKIFNIRLTPDKEMDNEVAFRFSKKLGIVANNDLAGEPVYITLKNLKTVNVPEDDGKKKVDGIAYNVPGKAQVTLTEGKKQWFNGELPVTQFGTIEYLAPALFNKKSTVQVTFNPDTGGLIKVDREEGE